MIVSKREEALAKELYEYDMGLHQAEDMPWDRQIEQVQTVYRRLASKFVKTRWFKNQIEEAVARGKENSDNRVS